MLCRAAQVMHLEQEAGKKALMLEAAEADEMFNLLLLHKDKLSPADQVLLHPSSPVIRSWKHEA